MAMHQHAGTAHNSQDPSASGGRVPVAPLRLQSSSGLVAVRVQSWAMSHGIGEDRIFVASLSRAVLKALAEYFRLLTCDGSLALLGRSHAGRKCHRAVRPGGDSLDRSLQR